MGMSDKSLTRRDFITGIVAAAGSTAAVAAFPPSILESGQSKQAKFALASSSTPAPSPNPVGALRPIPSNFVSGILVAATSKDLTIRTDGYTPNPAVVQLATTTELCRYGCKETWSHFRPGDRIDTSTYTGPGGLRIARWADANLLGGWGEVTTIRGSAVSISPEKMYGVKRTLLVESFTTIVMPDGSKTLGDPHALKVGDYLHYTAGADVPDLNVLNVWALTIHCAVAKGGRS